MEKMNIKWNYTNKIVNDLLKINRAREIVDLLEIPVSVEEEIKKETIAKRVHYSTKIEGNSLDLNTVKKIIENTNNSHERNVLEVRNYYNALMYLNNKLMIIDIMITIVICLSCLAGGIMIPINIP